ncbi:MAG: NAD-dependent epimerase/dehydratase family protein, partial [Salinibacter sp.]
MHRLQGSRILLVGGAGFVGSHIVDQLLDHKPTEIRVLDNFVRGTRANLARALSTAPNPDVIQIIDGSMTDRQLVQEATDG